MTITALVEKTCTPCRGGIPPLTAQEVAVLYKQVPEWTIHDDARRIERTYRFRNFAQAFSLVHKAADLAEAEGHHPDISFGWGTRQCPSKPRRSRACTRTTSSWPRSWMTWPRTSRLAPRTTMNSCRAGVWSIAHHTSLPGVSWLCLHRHPDHAGDGDATGNPKRGKRNELERMRFRPKGLPHSLGQLGRSRC
jgi:hypothetical protein